VVPKLHSMHCEAIASSEYRPGTHLSHSELEPVVFLKNPAGHSLHSTAAGTLEIVPVGQSAQDEAPKFG